MDFIFLSYPDDLLPDLGCYVTLTPNAPPLTRADAASGLLLLDGTWRYAAKMEAHVPATVPRRSLPPMQTAYPRRQSEPNGLSSIEALYTAFCILGRSVDGLLDHYRWAQRFVDLNEFS